MHTCTATRTSCARCLDDPASAPARAGAGRILGGVRLPASRQTVQGLFTLSTVHGLRGSVTIEYISSILWG